ncbi:MAG: IS1182 family transposase [Candidatus Rokubacteria bacterium]|nr:IS1182 family transposase [Candidatus Rokubacteria bacterium]
MREANRSQLAWGRIDLDAQLPDDHPARAICAVIERLDLSDLYAPIEARDDVAGAPAIDPNLLLGLWVYATSEGEGSAREVWRLTKLHAAYRWICGGVEVGYHTLSDFRSQQGEVVNALITQVLALLMKQDLVDLHRVAQDGSRVRASAGASSFRREQTLQALMQEARAHLEAVTQEAADPALSARRAAAITRGAQQRIERLEAALKQIPGVTETKTRSGAKDATVRVSTTDPDARVMKMGDGGFRPAFNVQFATTTDEARVIVGVEVTNRGSDAGQSTPMLQQIEQRTGVRPIEMLVDGGYAQHQAIDQAAQQQVTLYAPVPKPRKGDTRDPHAPREDDSEAVAAWRQRMGTEEAKAIYKQRAATAETVNADAKEHRGLDSLAVRGLDKTLGTASLFALTYDILRLITLRG